MTKTFYDIIGAIEELDRDAAAFLSAILSISATWDDLVDQDKAVSDKTVNAAFTAALIDLPRNRFYLEHFHLLNPVLIASIHNWQIANRIERKEEKGRYDESFIIRSSYVDLFAMVGYILGGQEMAVQVGSDARRFAHDEGRQEYESALELERKSREAK